MKHRRISLFMFLMLAVMLSTALSKVAAQEGDPSEKPQADVLAADVAQTTSPPPNKSESEFNGNFISANRIDVGDVISGKIGNNKDQDFFLLDNFLSGSSLIDIDARVNGSQLDAVVCLYDHKKTEIACNDDSDGLDSLIYFGGGLGPGYIRVRDFNYPNEGGNDYYYTLSVSDPLLISASTNGSIEDMPFKQADILAWQKFNNGSEKWSMFFDASDMGIDGPQDVEAIGKIADPLSISLVLGWSQRLCIWDDDLGGCNKKQVKPHIVDKGIVYFAAGVFPYEGLYICALDAEDGSVVWKNDTIGDRAHELEFGGISPHGYLVASQDILYVPSGRSMPAAFDRRTGKFLFCASPGGKHSRDVGLDR